MNQLEFVFKVRLDYRADQLYNTFITVRSVDNENGVRRGWSQAVVPLVSQP